MGFWSALGELMLGRDGRLPDGFAGSAVLVFAGGSALMGLVAVALDVVLFSVRRRSVFNLAYGGGFWDACRLTLLWSIGSGVGGFLGGAANILQLSRAACIGVGVGWPLILPRLIDSFTKEKDHQSPAA